MMIPPCMQTFSARRIWCARGQQAGVRWAVFAALTLGILLGCGGQREIRIAGRTMGTTYHITIIGGYFTSVGQLRQAIDERLEAINASMSTYRPESEISRFNTMEETGKAFPVGGDFFQVVRLSRRLFDITAGAWDGTIDPLVDLWGFGRTQRVPRIPADSEIRDRLAQVGFDLIDASREGFLIKRHPKVTLDLASVAKGYGVDVVAVLIEKNAIVSAGGKGPVLQPDDLVDLVDGRPRLGPVDADAPLVTVQTDTRGENLTAHLH